MRALLLVTAFLISLAPTLLSAQTTTVPILPAPAPGVSNSTPDAAQLQAILQMRTLKNMGSRRGVQTGMSSPFLGGYGAPQMTPMPPAATKSSAKLSTAEKKALRKQRAEQKKAARQALKEAAKAKAKNKKDQPAAQAAK